MSDEFSEYKISQAKRMVGRFYDAALDSLEDAGMDMDPALRNYRPQHHWNSLTEAEQLVFSTRVQEPIQQLLAHAAHHDQAVQYIRSKGEQ